MRLFLSSFLLFALLLVACGATEEVPTFKPVPTEEAVGTTTATEETGVEPTPSEVVVVEPTATAAEAESQPVTEFSEEPPVTSTFQLEAWADNWFAAYLGEELIKGLNHCLWQWNQ